MKHAFSIVILAVLLLVVGKVAANSCVSDFLMDGDSVCERGLYQAYTNDIKPLLDPITRSGKTAVIGRCSCYGNQDIVSCSSSFTLNGCISDDNGNTNITFNPLIRGQGFSSWIVNPSEPARDAVREVEMKAGEGAAAKFLEAYGEVFDSQ